jgi:hypothetical protein
MPANLRAAHSKLDAQVISMYGLKPGAKDTEILEILFTMYAEQSKS